MPVTMKDVASHAKVSDTTVARVLDNHPYVSKEIVQRVNQAIEELGYVPVRKRRHRQKETYPANTTRTGLVGFLLVQWTPDYLTQPLMSEIMTATERYLAAADMQMVFTQLPDPTVLPTMITPNRMDGILLMGQSTPQLRNALMGHNVVLMLGGPRHTGDDYWADGISSDYPACGDMAARYLIDRGHKHIAYLNPISNHGGFQEIGWTFQATAQRYEVEVEMLTCNFHSLQSGIWDRQKAQKAMIKQLKKIAEAPVDRRPTGLHIPADDFTVMAYELLKSLGLKLGVDVEVISRRNQELFLSQMNPRPATIDINTDEMGRRATEKLLSRIATPNAPAGARLLIPPKLIVPENQ